MPPPHYSVPYECVQHTEVNTAQHTRENNNTRREGNLEANFNAEAIQNLMTKFGTDGEWEEWVHRSAGVMLLLDSL